MTIGLTHLRDGDAFRRAYDVMLELRSHLSDVDAFVDQLQRQQMRGYELLAAVEGQAIVGLAGYRIQENLLYGKFIYLDDLVVAEQFQNIGAGGVLLNAIRQLAREANCSNFVLDTGLHKALAQRFYFRHGLLARGMHFVEPLNATAV